MLHLPRALTPFRGGAPGGRALARLPARLPFRLPRQIPRASAPSTMSSVPSCLGPSARCQLEQHLPRAPLQPLPRIRARARHAAPFSPPQGRGRLAPARPPKWHCPDGCQLLAVCAPTPRRDRRAPRGCRLGLATSHRHHTVVGARPASADSAPGKR